MLMQRQDQIQGSFAALRMTTLKTVETAIKDGEALVAGGFVQGFEGSSS
jgi:hypothetical protein